MNDISFNIPVIIIATTASALATVIVVATAKKAMRTTRHHAHQHKRKMLEQYPVSLLLYSLALDVAPPFCSTVQVVQMGLRFQMV